jgi:hypothetical protein
VKDLEFLTRRTLAFGSWVVVMEDRIKPLSFVFQDLVPPPIGTDPHDAAKKNDKCRARHGKLVGRKGLEILTPNSLALSSRGVVPHLTPDVLAQHTQLPGLLLGLEDCEFCAPKWL